jgi:hypothetical protein
MWNGHHPSENGNGDDSRNDPPGTDPSRFAAVSALAAFSQGAYPSQPASAMPYPANAASQASFRGQEGSLPIDPSMSYQEQAQALRQQALYAYQHQQQRQHPMHHAAPQQLPQQYSLEELEYSRQMTARRDAEQFQRIHEQQQQQRWGSDPPPSATATATTHSQNRSYEVEGQQHPRPSSEPDGDTSSAGSVRSNSPNKSKTEWARAEQTSDQDSDHEDMAMAMANGDAVVDATEGQDEDENKADVMDVDEEPDDSDNGSVEAVAVPAIVPRGKPEAMAVRLAAAAMEETLEDLEAERQETEAEVVAEAVIDDSDGVVLAKVEKPKPSRSRSLPKKSKKQAPPSSERTELLLSEEPPGITEDEYENLESLMIQFCRVPLLAEFSRPVTLLHPEVR